ncbi:MAG: fibronectin type III domain-containing protein, partial [Tepidisphaeraceae bacterium]
VLAPIGNKTVAPGATLNIPVSATDSDGNAIVLSASGLPAWATFTDNGNGTGQLSLSPPAGTSGTFNGLTVTATDNGSPVMSDFETLSVTVAAPSSVVTLVLINADTDEPIGPLTNGSVINYGLIGTNRISVRADAPAGTGSLRFGFDGNPNYRTESSAPYTIAGDSAGNYVAWTPSLGAHTLTATPFTGSSGSGSAGTTVTVNFTVIEGSTLVAAPSTISFTAPQNGTAASQNITLTPSDGVPAGWTATSNSAWLLVGSVSGNTGQPLVLSINTTALPLGTHQAYVTVKSPTQGGVKIPVTLTVTGAFVADQIHLSFVQNPATTMTVVWRTMNTATPSIVEYRALGNATWLSSTGAQRTAGTTGKLHQTNLAGLVPATTYEYRVRGDNSAWSPIFTTRTMPPAGPADFEAIYFGDTGLIGRTDGLDTGAAQAIAEMKRLDPELYLPGGDYAYFDTDKRFGTLENTIDQWFNQNQTIFSRSPIMPTYGNHEALLGEGYTQWAQRFATPTGFDSNRNYSFNVGDVHFISIFAVENSNDLTNSTLTWLTNDLAAAQEAGKKWIIPFMHVPAFADGLSHPSNVALRNQLGPVFEQYGVKVVLASHDQSYERTYPIDNVPSNITRTDTSLSGYDANDGVTWVKVSPAGKLSNHRGVNDFSKFQTIPAPFWTAVRDDTMHHFSRLVFSASGTLRVETYGFSGDGTPATIMDSFE